MPYQKQDSQFYYFRTNKVIHKPCSSDYTTPQKHLTMGHYNVISSQKIMSSPLFVCWAFCKHYKK